MGAMCQLVKNALVCGCACMHAILFKHFFHQLPHYMHYVPVFMGYSLGEWATKLLYLIYLSGAFQHVFGGEKSLLSCVLYAVCVSIV